MSELKGKIKAKVKASIKPKLKTKIKEELKKLFTECKIKTQAEMAEYARRQTLPAGERIKLSFQDIKDDWKETCDMIRESMRVY